MKHERKLSEKQVKKVQKNSLKLFPSTPKLQMNQPVSTQAILTQVELEAKRGQAPIGQLHSTERQTSPECRAEIAVPRAP